MNAGLELEQLSIDFQLCNTLDGAFSDKKATFEMLVNLSQ